MASRISSTRRLSRLSQTDTSVTPQESESGTPAKKRKIFLQTMGQQLREFGSLRDSAEDEASGFSCTPSGIYFIRSVYGGLAADRAARKQSQIQTPESDIATGEGDQFLPGSAKTTSKYLWLPAEVKVLSAADVHPLISFDELIDWSRSYFDNWHSAYPFLHAPTILEFFDHFAQHGLPDTGDTAALHFTILRSIMSISLADRRQKGLSIHPIPDSLVFTSYRDAINSIHGVLADESSILALQAVVSVQVFLLSMLRYNAVSRLEGISVRMLFQLGLHHCPFRYPAFSKQDAQLRQRLFWSVYCIDRYICNRLGLPLSIRDDDVDICYPRQERRLEDCNHPPESDARLDLLGFLAKHATIRGSIMQLRSKPDSKNPTASDQSVAINADLTKWWNEVDEYLETTSHDESVPISPFHQITLAILALQNCISASRTVIMTLYKALTSEEKPTEFRESKDTPLLWPSFTWAVWMSAFIMIYAANEDQTPKEVAIRLADKSLEIFKHLATRGSIWPDACVVAIIELRGQLLDRHELAKRDGRYSVNNIISDDGREGSQPSGPILQQDTGDGSRTAQSESQAKQPDTQYPETPFSRFVQSTSARQGSTSRDGPRILSNDNPESTFPTAIDPTIRSASRANYESELNTIAESVRHNGIFPDFQNYLEPQFNLNGSLQQGLGSYMLNDESMNLFYGSDIPFWMGDN